MRNDLPAAGATWRAALSLAFERRGARSVLAGRRHEGPLVVQKALYPEGPEVCHAIVVHPPGGIAGGDQLRLECRAGPGAAALLTTPGATRWYRTAALPASQHVALQVGPGACLEWLPQETIVFNGADAESAIDVSLDPLGSYVGWEILCLGRTRSGERFRQGVIRPSHRLRIGDSLAWMEAGEIAAGGLLDAPAGLAGATVCGTLAAAGPDIGQVSAHECRAIQPVAGEGAVTRLPAVFVARYLGDSAEAARGYFTALWRVLRPALAGRAAREPRIWST